MENKINIAEILKDCPNGTELYSPLCGRCVFDRLNMGTIICKKQNTQEITFTSEGFYMIPVFNDCECVLFPSKDQRDWSKFQRPFKDGDILVHTQNQRSVMSIYHKRSTELRIKTHCILWDKDEGLSVNMTICCYPDKVRLATEEEKQKLFQAIKENGYKWNPETKTLEKLIEPKFKVGDRIRKEDNNSRFYTINGVYSSMYGVEGRDFGILIEEQDEWELLPQKFDITTLKPFDKVLVRDNNEQKWTVDLFSFYDKDLVYTHACVGHYVNQCIPYEGNEHLLGKTDDCDEYYKTWE